MDVSKIPIKINQTQTSDGGNQNASSQADGTSSFSKQVLAIVHLLHTSGSNSNQSSEGDSSKTSRNQKGEKKLNSAELIQINSLLTALQAYINPVQSPAPALQQTSESASAMVATQPLFEGAAPVSMPGSELISKNGLQTSAGPAIGDPDMKNSNKIGDVLSQLIQKLDQNSQGLSPQQIQLVKNLQNLVGDNMQSGVQMTNDQVNMLEEGIRRILNDSKLGNTPTETVSQQGTGTGEEKNQKVVPGSISQLNLDKNQAGIPAQPSPTLPIQRQNDLAKNSAFKQSGEQTQPDKALIAGSQALQSPEGSNTPKEQSASSVVPVSEFVPEVSEWVDRFVKISHGQSGSAEAKFSLYPEHLGPVEVKITSLEGQLTAQIVTGTQVAKDALAGQLPQLREALQQHGLQVQKIDIVQQQSGANPSSLPFSQGGYSSPQEQKQFHPNRGSSRKRDGDDKYGLESTPSAIPYSGTASNLSSRIDFTA